VTALIRDPHDAGAGESVAALLAEVAAGPPADLPSFLVRARRLGLDLSAGAVAVSARRNGAAGKPGPLLAEPGAPPAQLRPGTLLAELRPGALLVLAPAGAGDSGDPAAGIVARLREAGLVVAASSPRHDAGLLHEAVREAELLAELGADADADEPAGSQGETYRLLIGVLLRDPHELELLRDHTISPLLTYDAEHDTELLGTLGTFLARHGSTTETAETMRLHRHTVGYRLSRVQEVSGLSPYESDGRERLSLGLKAAQILAADERLSQPG
jgi:hypothetical protein